ncbi:MAG TPA: N-acetylmuramic acid 6-phosphate etherase, partial [Rhodobacteraceae bacterium]|nr:N-acetylmuramic acid 6-phosphate etherase [Paracoccaceae bacterium]
LEILHRAQVAAAGAVADALPALERAAAAVEAALRGGASLVYAAAGSSALQAMADGLEIPPTFGIPAERIHILRAGGLQDLSVAREGAEDDAEAARRAAEVIAPGDAVICLAASGNTIYPVTIMEIARARGATTIGMSNNPGAKLLSADIPVLLPTPPEVIAGSTRMGAGTAQKIALNLISTLVGIRLGHVLDGLMVNVATSNIKLKGRAAGIVRRITGCDAATAEAALAQAGWRVKEAVLIVSGAGGAEAAREYLERAGQNLRAALAELSGAHPENANAQSKGEKP